MCLTIKLAGRKGIGKGLENEGVRRNVEGVEIEKIREGRSEQRIGSGLDGIMGGIGNKYNINRRKDREER